MAKDSSLKYILITIGAVTGVVIIGFLIWAFLLAQAFNWKPPSTELDLSQNEIAWKKQVEKNYDCTIHSIRLDEMFMEDSVIYVDVDVEPGSTLQQSLIGFESTEKITKELAVSFQKRTAGRDAQNCIQFRFDNLFFNDASEQVRYPLSKKCLYAFKTKSVMIF